MSYRGGATLAWQSDYAQFYLVDIADERFEAPVEITPEMMSRRFHPTGAGLVVYTNDCLQQLIEIRIFGAEPVADAVEWRSGKAWTHVASAEAMFPSRAFTVTSPSLGSSGGYGPNFRVDAAQMIVRIQWMEFEGARDDSRPVEPDVIRLDLWPA